ncbi:MAG: hypothetical protein ACI89X_001111 [Planctomycetota bacterium]|jgi:hypothetical protein
MRLLLLTLVALPFLLTSCSEPVAGSGSRGAATSTDPSAPAISDKVGSKEKARLILDHDFGIVPHGEQREHEFDLDLSQLLEPHVPLRVHLECSCGKAVIRMRKPDGTERGIDGSGYPHNLPQEDEKVIMRITLDTRKKEAVDLPKAVSRGYILLQALNDTTGMARIRWSFIVRFGIDAPVVLHPFAALDFGSIAQSRTGRMLTTLRGDDNHPNVKFTSVETSDPDIEATLEVDEDHVVLRANCTPGETGNHRALVLVRTDIPDYTVALNVFWKVVPDLEASPINKVSISAHIDKQQPESAMKLQSVLVTDHNRLRSPEFVLGKIVGNDGRDVTSLFAVTLTPVPNKERQQRMEVRYLGGLLNGKPAEPTYSFRGKIVLTKKGNGPAGSAPTLPIELVVFPSRKP